MARLRADYVYGTTSAALTSGGTTLSGAALARLPAVTGTDTAAVTLFDATTGTYEIVWVTAHTAGTTTATITRAQEGSTAAAWASGATWAHGPTAMDAMTGTLASVTYNPGTLAAYSKTASTAGDLDATNLAVTFTTPLSGRVRVRLNGLCGQSAAGGSLFWSLREGTTDLLATFSQVTNLTTNNRHSLDVEVSGLTPGSVHTYKWGWASSSGITANFYAGGVAGPATIEVNALP